MDYETKPTSRKQLRVFAGVLREIFDVPPTGPFPVLDVLDKVSEVFTGSRYLIVSDDKLPPQTMACCTPNDDGGYDIEIKESVYRGAYEKRSGACLGFICHELCHVFLFEIGFKPIVSRSIANGAVPAYRSVEWQAKALCAEVMIPFDESVGMSQSEIIDMYHVSKGFAKKRIKLNK